MTVREELHEYQSISAHNMRLFKCNRVKTGRYTKLEIKFHRNSKTNYSRSHEKGDKE